MHMYAKLYIIHKSRPCQEEKGWGLLVKKIPRKLRIDRDSTSWKIQIKLRRFEGLLCIPWSWAYGPSLIGEGGGHSIVWPNRQNVGERGGSPKNFFRTHPKQIFRDIPKTCQWTYKILPDISKIFPNITWFSQTYKNFFATYISPEIFRFCTNIALIFARPQKFWGGQGAPPAHTPMLLIHNALDI